MENPRGAIEADALGMVPGQRRTSGTGPVFLIAPPGLEIIRNGGPMAYAMG